MAETDLGTWMERVNKCRRQKEVFAILDDFRKQNWTDEECSQMGRHYIRVISNMAAEDTTVATEEKPADAGNANDGPVWYEKM